MQVWASRRCGARDARGTKQTRELRRTRCSSVCFAASRPLARLEVSSLVGCFHAVSWPIQWWTVAGDFKADCVEFDLRKHTP
uniref:Uncharacterized protein n=1 Tax=Kalanchoe fedtschenkoi TaxID=63787 RepID=A0A7N0SZM7_KALFE